MFTKQCTLLLFILCITVQTAHASRSIFIPRSVTTDSIYELALTQFDRYHDAAEYTNHVYVKPFYLKSTNCDLASYFLPNCKRCISVDETGNGDIDPLWFWVIAPDDIDYTSTVCMKPQRKAYGALLSYYAHFCERWWVGIHTAAMGVTHNLRIKECDRSAFGTCPGFATMCDGFNNPDWCAGKLACCPKTRAGFDDIQFKVGYDYHTLEEDCKYSSVYFVFTAPTGRKKLTTNVFEPLVGSRHASIGFGLNGGTDWQVGDYDDTLTLMADIKYRYVLQACERRSFDLRENGDWSRYLLVVTEDELANSQPAINVLTLPSKVTPGSTVDIWLALHYQHCAWHLEVGYDFWWRRAEKVCPQKRCFNPDNMGIQTLALCGDTISSASTATISQGVLGDTATVTDSTFTPIAFADINPKTGAQPRSLSNSIYVDAGYTLDYDCYSVLFGLGISYEGGVKNALKQWGIWYTQGISF